MIKLFINNVKTRLSQYGPFRRLDAFCSSGMYPVEVLGTEPGFLPLLTAIFSENRYNQVLAVLPTQKEAEDFASDIQLFLGDCAHHFPSWQTVPYSDLSAASWIHAKRSRVLSLLLGGKRIFTVAPLAAFLSPLPEVEKTRIRLFPINSGKKLDLESLVKMLSEYGYDRVPRVTLPGEFAVRGEVLDLFLPGESRPIRLLLDFETVENIRYFDPITQRSQDFLDSTSVPPLSECIMLPGEEEKTMHAMREKKIPEKAAAEAFERMKQDPYSSGLEYTIPLTYTHPASILDYMSQDSAVFFIDYERLHQGAEMMEREYKTCFARIRGSNKPVAPPETALLQFTQLESRVSRKILFPMHKSEKSGQNRVVFACDPPHSYFGNIVYFTEEMGNLTGLGYSIYIFADYEAQAERIRHLVQDLAVSVIPAGITRGFTIPELKLMLIHENEIFRRKKHVARTLRKIESEKIDSFVDLEEGDFIVHFQHGIGCYRGLHRIKAAGNERDYITLEYADKEIIYLPTEQVNLVERYITPGIRSPRLDKIGGRSWAARKAKVKKAVEDIAAQLLDLYSKRLSTQGIAFGPDSDWQEQFEAGFPYEETPDQISCIAQVKSDMEQPCPMDRLVCGDVGYGKTEIALRAAFKAVMSGKQAALLAPTTILVEQHFETFEERFEGFPVKIAMLSRFVSAREQKKVVQGLADHSVDIVIGTHRLLQKDVAFKDLGLLVVDEEQRFGVKHKERIKELKATVDCLTLTATPIPRTLYMSLVKIRDMSQLSTPPQNRLPIETFVTEFNEDIIKKAISHEIERGGQVFFLHNRIESIHIPASLLSRLFPHLRIAVAHGKLTGDELEVIMHDFIHGNYHILISTAIIENGIDIPNVNTIIIDRADLFGISQLYQLRGRVGRSDLPAFAYLLYPESHALTEKAAKRLKIISDHTELGSGFKIAMKDLEMRGAGNILGAQQHGDILAVGFEMYVKLLNEKVRELEGKVDEDRMDELYLELEYSGFMPDSYITEPLEKMETYKQIASITTPEDFDRVYTGIEDRFGPMPEELSSILSIAEIRILCKKLGIKSLREKQGQARIEFLRVSQISADKVMRLIRESGGKVFLNSHEPACIFLKTGSIGLKEKSVFIKEKLSGLL